MTFALFIGYLSVSALFLSSLILISSYVFSRSRHGLLHPAILSIRIPTRAFEARAASHLLFKELHSWKIPFMLEVSVGAFGEEIDLNLVISKRLAKRADLVFKRLLPEIQIRPGKEHQGWLSGFKIEPQAGKINYNRTREPLVISSADQSVFLKILNMFSNLKPLGESVLLQWTVYPAPEIHAETLGQTIEALWQAAPQPLNDFDRQTIVSRETLPDLEKKIGEPLFLVHGRFLVYTPEQERSSAIAESIENIFNGQTQGNCFGRLCLKTERKPAALIQDIIQRQPNRNQEGSRLNAAELTELFHFPNSEILPKLRRLV